MATRKKKIEEPVIEPEEMEPLDSEIDVQPEETFTFKRTHFYAVVTVLAFSVGVLLGYVVWGFDPSGGQPIAGVVLRVAIRDLGRYQPGYVCSGERAAGWRQPYYEPIVARW